PVLVEGYPCNQLLLQSGLQTEYYKNQSEIDAFLAQFTFDGTPPRTLGDLMRATRPLVDRFVHDQVDLPAFQKTNPHKSAKQVVASAYQAYCDELGTKSQLDFALLEKELLARLCNGLLDEGVHQWKAILVDEYQDTNPLQEAIYFELV